MFWAINDVSINKDKLKPGKKKWQKVITATNNKMTLKLFDVLTQSFKLSKIQKRERTKGNKREKMLMMTDTNGLTLIHRCSFNTRTSYQRMLTDVFIYFLIARIYFKIFLPSKLITLITYKKKKNFHTCTPSNVAREAGSTSCSWPSNYSSPRKLLFWLTLSI